MACTILAAEARLNRGQNMTDAPMKRLAERLKVFRRFPVVGPFAARLYVRSLERGFANSEQYWIERYARGGDSGPGSYEEMAQFKAEILNDFVARHDIRTVAEYGCGDGEQLGLANYPKYIGFDVSTEALARCEDVFGDDPTKTFKLMRDYCGERADLALSLDVIYHLVEDSVFESYMERLFDSANRYVIIYSSDTDEQESVQVPHVRHRRFSRWVEENRVEWELVRKVPSKYPYSVLDFTGTFSDFHIYRKTHSDQEISRQVY